MIKLIVLDVDGCLTDGRIIYSEDGNETKAFNVKDGLAIRTWLNMGRYAAIITGRRSTLVAKRAKELGIEMLHQGIKDKRALLEEIAAELKIQPYEIAAIGDDLNDYKMLQWVGHSYTPSDGSHYVRAMADKTLTCKGGMGAVREMIEDVVSINDESEAFLDFWL